MNEIDLPPNPEENTTNLMKGGGNRMKFLTQFCIDGDLQTVLELGRCRGTGSTYFILKSGAQLWSVDIDEVQYAARFLDNIPTYHKIIANDTQPIPEIDGKMFDMVFLDTSHGYQHTKYEINRYYPMARKWFLVDDYHWGDQNDKGVYGACQDSGLPFRYIGGVDIWGVQK